MYFEYDYTIIIIILMLSGAYPLASVEAQTPVHHL